MGNGAPAILACADRDRDGARIVAHQPQGCPPLPHADRDQAAVGCKHGSVRTAIEVRDRGVDLRTIAPDDRATSVHDHLGRGDIPPATSAGIIPLAFGEDRAGEDILPAELIPIGHGEAEREHVRPAGDAVHRQVRRRAGGTALALIQFDHRRMIPVRRLHRRRQGGEQQRKKGTHRHPPVSIVSSPSASQQPSH